MTLTESDQLNIERIVNFLYREGFDHVPKDMLFEKIEKIIETNCFVVVIDRLGVAALTWFDVIGWDAHVRQVIVRNDLRHKGLIKYLVILAWNKFPFLKRIVFERLTKYPNRPPKVYELTKLLGGY